MPVMDGLQTISHIKANEELKNTAVIALTAQAIIGDKKNIYLMVLMGILRKPMDTPFVQLFRKNLYWLKKGDNND